MNWTKRNLMSSYYYFLVQFHCSLNMVYKRYFHLVRRRRQSVNGVDRRPVNAYHYWQHRRRRRYRCHHYYYCWCHCTVRLVMRSAQSYVQHSTLIYYFDVNEHDCRIMNVPSPNCCHCQLRCCRHRRHFEWRWRYSAVHRAYSMLLCQCCWTVRTVMSDSVRCA